MMELHGAGFPHLRLAIPQQGLEPGATVSYDDLQAAVQRMVHENLVLQDSHRGLPRAGDNVVARCCSIDLYFSGKISASMDDGTFTVTFDAISRHPRLTG